MANWDLRRQVRMWLLIGVPLVVGGTLIRHYSFHTFELVMFGFSFAMTLFSICLVYRSWPSREQQLEDQRCLWRRDHGLIPSNCVPLRQLHRTTRGNRLKRDLYGQETIISTR